jgi:hypothetical protein
MEMKPKLFIIGICLMIAIACNPPVFFTSSVKTLENIDTIRQGTVIYALPKTTLRIDVEVSKTNYRKGPYYNYGEKYLGIEGGIEADREEWSISNIELNSYEEVDPEHYYIIEAEGEFRTNVLKFTREGLILPLNSESYRELPTNVNLPPLKYEKVLFTDLSVKKNLKEVKDTMYRVVETDTAIIRIPFINKEQVQKSLEEKAEEAADYIIKIRKRRFKLMSGQYEVFPEGIALEFAVKELYKLEDEYLALFLGKTYTEVHKYTFEFIPERTKIDEPGIIFRFSPQKGILSKNDLTGRPITIEIVSAGKTEPLEPIVIEQESDEQNIAKLYYRVPDLAQVQIIDGKNLLANKKLLIYQYGKILQLPSNFILERH